MSENTFDYPSICDFLCILILQTTTYIPPTLNSLTVPRDVTILYVNNVVKLVSGIVLREFRDVRFFFFWTGFNGTRMFRMTAPPDVNIYGGGIATLAITSYPGSIYSLHGYKG